MPVSKFTKPQRNIFAQSKVGWQQKSRESGRRARRRGGAAATAAQQSRVIIKIAFACVALLLQDLPGNELSHVISGQPLGLTHVTGHTRP